jgi:hypothetical protein
MTQLRLMNQLDMSTKFGDFNTTIMKGDPNINIDYEINPHPLAIFHRDQFTGEDTEEDPYKNLDFFTDLCGTFRLKNYIDDEVMLKIFNQSLTGTTLSWYRCRNHPHPGRNLRRGFLSKFYPKSKCVVGRRYISNFKNCPGKSLVRAYLRYKALIYKCPDHALPSWHLLHLTLSKAWELLDRIRRNRESWSFDLGSEGGIKIEYDCLRAFEQTGEVKAIPEEHYLDHDIVLHVL